MNNNRIDTAALNGLRGIVAVHIMIFHSFQWQINTLGAVQMPLFFLISGFILALNDGKTQYSQTKCCTELQSVDNDQNNDNDEMKKFDGKNFYRRRIARTIPLYYLTNIICIPLVFGGHTWLQQYLVDIHGFYIACFGTIFAVTTWFAPLILNIPSWFVSTIWFFYWIFPSLLPKLQKYTSQQKTKWLKIHYGLQFIVALILKFGTVFFMGDYSELAFVIAMWWPPSRLPVFIMGILAGLLRNTSNESNAHYGMRNNSDYLSIGIIITFIVCILIEIVSGGLSDFNFWLQLILPWWQLKYIASLTLEQSDNVSRTYKILSSKFMLQLGRISYALYLIHWPVMDYICFIVYGAQSQPECEYESNDQCKAEWDKYNDHRLMPMWCIPIQWIVSFLIAILLNRVIEEPMRKWLRPAVVARTAADIAPNENRPIPANDETLPSE